MSAIIELFGQIALPTTTAGGDRIPSLQLPGGHDRHIGKDELGRPLVLIKATRLAGEPVPISYVLENLRIDHELQCRIVDAANISRTDRFSVIRCLSADHDLQLFFLTGARAPRWQAWCR